MPYDRSSDDHRCLTFETEPLAADLEIVGSPEVVVSLSSDEPDFPFHVALCEVAPNGRSTLICQGWGRAAHLAGGALRPGEVYKLPVPLYATSSRIARGQRLRLVIAGADFPLLWPARRNPTLSVRYGPERGTLLRVPIASSPSEDSPAPPSCARIAPHHPKRNEGTTGFCGISRERRQRSTSCPASGTPLPLAACCGSSSTTCRPLIDHALRIRCSRRSSKRTLTAPPTRSVFASSRSRSGTHFISRQALSWPASPSTGEAGIGILTLANLPTNPDTPH